MMMMIFSLQINDLRRLEISFAKKIKFILKG